MKVICSVCDNKIKQKIHLYDLLTFKYKWAVYVCQNCMRKKIYVIDEPSLILNKKYLKKEYDKTLKNILKRK